MNMKRAFFSLLLVAFLFVINTSSIATQTVNDLEVSKVQWTHDINSKFDSKTSGSTSNYRSSFAVDFVQEISAVFRNTGSKAIKKVNWQFVFYKDENYREIEKLYTIKSRREISPNESVKLNEIGRIFDHSLYKKVNIFEIEYADGTIWKGKRLKD